MGFDIEGELCLEMLSRGYSYNGRVRAESFPLDYSCSRVAKREIQGYLNFTGIGKNQGLGFLIHLKPNLAMIQVYSSSPENLSL